MKTNLITALAFAGTLAIATTSCTNEDTMGATMMPADDDVTILATDTLQVKAYTELEDTVYTGNQTYLMLGNLQDPIFGSTNCSFFAKFSNTSYSKFKEGAIIDSVVLTLGLDTNAKRFYGDSTNICSVDVYAVTTPMDYSKRYYQTFDISPYVGNKIGTATFIPNVADTAIKFSLDNEYGELIMAAQADTTFDEKVCGLYFKASDDNQGNCLMKIKYNSSFTEYNVYYHCEGDEAESSALYSVSVTDTRFSMAEHDYSNTCFYEQLLKPSTIQDSYLYLQCLGGTRVKLEFPDIAKFNNFADKYFILSRAELILPLADTAVSGEDEYSAIGKLACLGLYPNGSQKYFSEFLTSSNSLITIGRSYKSGTYNINLTTRIKDLLDTYSLGSTPDYSIYLYPYGRAWDFERSIINSPSHPDKPMRLVVEYITYNR